MDSSDEDEDSNSGVGTNDSDSDSEVTINTSSLSNGNNKRKSIFGLTRTPTKNPPVTDSNNIRQPQVTLSKFDLLTQSADKKKVELIKNDNQKESTETVSDADSVVAMDQDVDSDEDSEYETEEVYELREWYPPDFWRAKDQDNANRVCQTDVTANDLTVTMFERRVCDGFFKAL